ncbi:MAG: helix-hairpin-helix domain-containing protein [Anaerolineae bacterium]|nr:helix-hairpin-helix domain-containing protein [Anaerolineae bacterium]MCO5192875.1 helix-hairpin-helix domain-containing protein [Anaerolineae bacterium]MCO5205271.1 helix-hairpin-helix domain-containing protein [Anaerolineae bacterium]
MEVFAAVVGAGIVVASPFLPVLRPVAKAAVKGGLAVSEAVVGTAVVVGHQVNEVVSKSKSGSATESAETHADEAVDDAAVEAEATAAGGKKVGLGTLTAAVRPTAQAVAKAGVAVTDKAKEAAKGAGKQWSDLVSEARASQGDADEPDTEVELVVEREAPVAKAPAAEKPIVEKPTTKAAADKKPAAKKSTAKKPTAAQPDDLTQIRGIGPKTATLLIDAGIKTYGQLAAADTAQLRDILDQAGTRYRSINPDGWPEQASQLVTTS